MSVMSTTALTSWCQLLNGNVRPIKTVTFWKCSTALRAPRAAQGKLKALRWLEFRGRCATEAAVVDVAGVSTARHLPAATPLSVGGDQGLTYLLTSRKEARERSIETRFG
jgi:hypothetical protein